MTNTVSKIKAETDKQERETKVYSQFIFDETQLIKKKPFPFLIYGKHAGFGMFLPKEEDKIDKRGNIVGRHQVLRPVVISSDGNMYQVDANLEKNHRIKFGELPNEENYGRRWSLASIQQYIYKDKEFISGAEIFEDIKRLYKKYLYFSEDGWYDVHTLWDIATYFFFLFKYFPIFELRGLKGTAKTKIMTLSRGMSFNATEEMTNPSEATLFRDTHDRRPTKYIDECEKLFMKGNKGQILPDARAELINSSYKCTGTVPRQEKQGNKFTTIYYKTYSPTMVGSINGLYGATEDRAIIHVTVKPPRGDKRGEIEPDEDDPIFQQIRDKLYIFALQNWSDIKTMYDEFTPPEELQQRDFWIWKPVLVIGKYIDEMISERLLKFAMRLTQVKKLDVIGENSTEYRILETVKKMMDEGISKVLIKEIHNQFGGEYKPGNRKIGRIMDSFGFRDMKKHFDLGNGYEITKDIFNRTIISICPNLCDEYNNKKSYSLSSVSSGNITKPQNSNTREDIEVIKTEERMNIMKKEAEDNEANEDNEDKIDMVVSFIDILLSIEKSDGIIRFDSIGAQIKMSEDEIVKKLEFHKKRGDIFPVKGGYKILR